MKSYLPKIIKKKDCYVFHYKSINFKFFNYDFKAIELIENGYSLKILSEEDFYEIISS